MALAKTEKAEAYKKMNLNVIQQSTVRTAHMWPYHCAQ